MVKKLKSRKYYSCQALRLTACRMDLQICLYDGRSSLMVYSVKKSKIFHQNP